jgi:hypothetical protein
LKSLYIYPQRDLVWQSQHLVKIKMASAKYSPVESLFGDAAYFFNKFKSFMEQSPRPSPPFRLYAYVTVEYTLELGGGGGNVMETTVLRTTAAAVQGDLKKWWCSNVLHSMQRFLSRFASADVTHISYVWVNNE